MECDRILELLPGRLDGSLEEPRETEVERHLRDCPRCAAEEEALKETLALLRNLPPEKAPPELLEGVRRRIATETGPTAPGKGLFASARVRIPLEAAAAVLLFLLVYGIQRQIPETDRPAAPPVRVEAISPSGETPGVRTDRETKTETEPAVPPRRIREPASAARGPAGKTVSLEQGAIDSGRMEPSTARAPREHSGVGESRAASEDRIDATLERKAEPLPAMKASLPAVSATRVSTGAETVVPRSREEERAEAPAPIRVFAAPPSRLLRPMPYGRELVLEVAGEQREGLEERIIRVVEGFGGSILREWRFSGTPSGDASGTSVSEGPMRIQVPAGSSEDFLSELQKLGTIPPEGMPASSDLPAGPTPDVVAYTVRIRVR